MTESLAYRQTMTAQGARCADPDDLKRYLYRVATDAHSLRDGVANAIAQVFAGGPMQYRADWVEHLLTEDLKGAGIVISDSGLATALRQTLRFLEDVAQAADLSRDLLERNEETVATQPNQTLCTPA